MTRRYLLGFLLCSFAVGAVFAVTADQEQELKDKLTSFGITEANLTQFEDIMKEKCKKEGHEDAYAKILTAKDDAMKCFEGLIDPAVLEAEIEEAKPNGELDKVFKKYCNKKPQFENCINNFTTTIEVCLTEKEKNLTKTITTVTEKLIKFVCHKEGDRIALFIAEGGPGCLESKSDAIQDCVNSTMHKHLPTEMPTLDNLPELVLDAEKCADVDRLQTCVVDVLEGCREPTPANIAESLFKYVRAETPCNQYEKAGTAAMVGDGGKGGAAPVTTLLSTVLLAATAALLA